MATLFETGAKLTKILLKSGHHFLVLNHQNSKQNIFFQIWIDKGSKSLQVQIKF